MFDVLVYTDAEASESLNGSSGFQFIAKSAGATATDEEVVHRRLQHSVPVALRPDAWQSHPATCTFANERGRMYLGLGRSTGATLSGRPGNQLTQAIATSDPYDILPLRPAQLFSTPMWSCVRPQTQELPAWSPPLEIASEFEVGFLHELVADDSWSRSALASILTMLEQTQSEPRVRLLLRHPDQVVVMRWVALLSQFLDAEAALQLEFRVYSETPLSADAHILGVHPDLSPDLLVERLSGGVNLVDLVNRRCSAIEPSDSARQYAEWFLNGEPYEALDAVELSRRWARAMPSAVAIAAAEVACLGSRRITGAGGDLASATAALGALALNDQAGELDSYGNALVDAVEACGLASADDLLLVVESIWALVEAGSPELAQALMLFALEWGASRPGDLVGWARAHQQAHGGRRLVWPDEGARARGATLLGTILEGTEARDLPALFSLSAALNTGIAATDIGSAIERLAALWVTNPRLTPAAQSWLHAAAVRDVLRKRLLADLSGGDAGARSTLRSGMWDWLAPVPWVFQANDPLSVWLAVRALAGANGADREAILAQVLPHVDGAAWELYLSPPEDLDPNEVAAWIRARRELHPTLIDRIERSLDQVVRLPAWYRGGAARVLDSLASVEVAGLPIGLQTHVSGQKRILSLFDQAKAARKSKSNRALRQLAQPPNPALARIYGEWVVEAIVCCEDHEAALELARGALEETADRLRVVLEEHMRAGSREAISVALYLLDAEPELWSRTAKQALDAIWDDRAARGLRERLVQSLHLQPSSPLGRTLSTYEAKRKGTLARVVDFVRSPSLFKPKDR